MDFWVWRSMQVHSVGLPGTGFIPLNVFEGELPLMLFSLPLGQRARRAVMAYSHQGGPHLAITQKALGHDEDRWDGQRWWSVRLAWSHY